MMRPRAWLATWAEIGSLVADHIGEGLTMLARVIDPPPEREVVDEGAADRAWIVQSAEWCDVHNRTETVRRLYTQTGGQEPTYRGQASDHEEDE